ncbi:NADPH-dependent FMN reductase [Niallia nealsonii]|uniref:FMN reductase (NADPH) n=1 Tax=Niallia nealsonii TaxID=115979 RepID=A0A2N0Z0L9_9BACI|nr:NADPH-dependent FMN reductase [Niallia nealsonii]PKG23062.1 FMN reductase (NADPH) [Niallia nealsonii]
MAKVIIITGAPNDYSRLNGILDYSIKLLKKTGISYDVIKVHELPAEDLIQAKFDSEAIRKANKKVENAAGVLIFTPVYKAAYSGIVKTYLDLLPQKGLEDKIILPLVIGGSFGHLLTIEYALNPVLSALGATYIIKGVYTIDKDVERLDNNQFSLKEEVQQRIEKGIDAFIKVISD